MAMELKHAILGLLSIQPMSGYDLNRAFSNTVAHFWYADQSQIYRTLDKLTANKAITTKVIHQEGKPNRKVHSLTATGRAELEDWLTSPLEQERFKEPFMARLFFAANLTYTEVVQLLAEREKQIERKLQSLKAIDAPAEDLASALRRSLPGFSKPVKVSPGSAHLVRRNNHDCQDANQQRLPCGARPPAG